jgi:putative salt-induced outer membrane protein YdiY
MLHTKHFLIFLSIILFCVNIYPQDAEKKTGWFFEGQVAGLWTAGNSESVTYGLGATLRHLWVNSELRFDAGGTQTESGLTSRTAVGTTDAFLLRENTITEKTAELFYARGRYDYNFSEFLYALGGLDWLRNKFAGIDSRFLLAAGLGNTWAKEENIRFKTDYSFTYTFQSEVVENPFSKNEFPGVRFSYDFWYKLTKSTEFSSIFIADWNLDNTDDIRIDFTNALPVAISDVFTLKPTFQLRWRNDPALTEVDLFAPDGTPAGAKVFTPLQKLDTMFSLALVVKL